MLGSDIENGLQRGVLFWWLFCVISTSSTMIGLNTITTMAISVFALPLIYSRAQRAAYNVSNPGRRKNDLAISALASGHGFVQYILTAAIWPSWSPFLKAALITAILHLIILWAKREKDPETAYNNMAIFNQIPAYLRPRLQAARQLGNPFRRLSTLFFCYLGLYAFLATTVMWAVNFALPQKEIPRFRLLQRRFRLRLKSWLFHAFRRSHGPLYKHVPLTDDTEKPTTIRLLKVLKRLPFGDICCELHEVDLDSGIQYESISYHWGAGAEKEPIFIDGKAYLVSQSVLDVLFHLSSYREERLVWIDSICIDQSNNAEKSSQISIMRDIYRNSSTTTVWLDGIDEPWKVRTMLAGLMYENRFGTTESCFALLRQYSETWAEAGWAQLMNLFANSYFFRVWVIQEVVMASSVTILASGEPLNWGDISTVAEMMLSLPYNVILQSGVAPGVKETYPQGMAHANVMARLGQDREVFQPSLAFLLGYCTDFQSTEAVDKVYALLGLLSPTDEVHEWMVTDYSMSASQLYALTAKNLIPDECNEILSYAGIGYHRNISDLPSWAPDWTSHGMMETYRQHFTKTQHSNKYQASAGAHLTTAQQSITFLTQQSTRPPMMRILGHRFDKIAYVGPVLTYTEHNFGEGPTVSVLLEVITQHMRARKLANTYARQPYPTGEPLEDVFWRTLIGNTQFERPAPAELGIYCRVWERMMIEEFGKDVEELHDETNTLLSMEQLQTAGLKEDAMRGGLMWNSSRIMCCTGRAFCVTEQGYVSMAPPGTAVGDSVCILYGLNTPFVLRDNERSLTEYRNMQLVGEAYVHGMMDGEAMLVDPLEIEHFDVT